MYNYNEIKNAYQDALRNMYDGGVAVFTSAAYKRYLKICKNEKREYKKYAKETTDKENT
jgi:hypothetical protein